MKIEDIDVGDVLCRHQHGSTDVLEKDYFLVFGKDDKNLTVAFLRNINGGWCSFEIKKFNLKKTNFETFKESKPSTMIESLFSYRKISVREQQ